MPDREKVMSGLESCVLQNPDDHRECVKCPYHRRGITNEPCFNALHIDALALLKEQEARWIPVTERMPEDGEIVLCAVYGTDMIVWENGESIEDAVRRARSGPGRVETGYRDAEGYWTDPAFGGPMMVTPRYWMPLPDPPKEEENGT